MNISDKIKSGLVFVLVLTIIIISLVFILSMFKPKFLDTGEYYESGKQPCPMCDFSEMPNYKWLIISIIIFASILIIISKIIFIERRTRRQVTDLNLKPKTIK